MYDRGRDGELRADEAALPEPGDSPRGDAKLRAWRVEQYVRLGFPDWTAQVLADTRDADGVPLYWGDVEALLQRGASHSDALRIFF